MEREQKKEQSRWEAMLLTIAEGCGKIFGKGVGFVILTYKLPESENNLELSYVSNTNQTDTVKAMKKAINTLESNGFKGIGGTIH